MDVTKSIFEGLDWLVLGLYFAILVGVAVWVALQRNKNTEDYFLAGRNVGWFVIGASIFASNIGSEHVVGLAGTGFSSGTPLAHYELHAWIVLLLGWLFLPFYIRSGAFTMPEFLEKRFDSRSRWFLSVFSLFAYVLTKVSVTIYAGGIVVSELLNLDFWVGAIGIVIFTGIYTIIGGLKAVVYTETLQTVVLIVGSVIITYLGFQEVGGWNQLTASSLTLPGVARAQHSWTSIAGEKYADSIKTFFVLSSQAVFFPPRIPARLITPLSSQITTISSSSS